VSVVNQKKPCNCRVTGFKITYNQPDATLSTTKPQFVICETLFNAVQYVRHLEGCMVTDIQVIQLSEKVLDMEQIKATINKAKK
jgi:hypothetical protein